MEHLIGNFAISQIPLDAAVLIPDHTPLERALDKMREEKVGSLLTMDNQNNINGIFTERDLLNKIAGQGVMWEKPIFHFSTPAPIMLHSGDSLSQALRIMRQRNIRNIPVLETDGQVCGILSIQNIIRLFAEHFPEDVLNLPPNLHHHPTTPEGG